MDATDSNRTDCPGAQPTGAAPGYIHELATLAELDAIMAAAACDGDKPVIVDFSATWCGPCKRVGPVFNALANQHQDGAVFAKVDVDEAQDVASQYQITCMPTFLVVRRGRVVDSLKGANAAALEALVVKWRVAKA